MEFLVIAIFLLMTAANVVCFVIGAKVGQSVSKSETIEIPRMNPLEAIREHAAEKQSNREQERMATIVENMENYDGTSYGQKEVPRW